MASPSKIVYCHSKEYLEVCNLPPKIKGRAFYVHKLLDAYELLDELRVESPSYLSPEALQLFHCKDYITCVHNIQEISTKKQCSDDDDNDDDFEELAVLDLEGHGLEYDCAPFSRVMDYISMVAGASVKCAELLNEKSTKIAINLYGGWHHAHRDSAAGFCYINDVVLAILKLKEKFNRVLYVDIDVHHGDGVEEAFSTTDKVMTVSFHKLEDGYFPGSGRVSDTGYGRGKFHAVNVPLKDGIDDQQYYDVFSRIMDDVKGAFEPEVIVCQCGADGVAGDPLGGFNLTNKGMAKIVKYIADWKLPLLVLGGGGYNFINTAKTWASIIAALLEKEIPNDVPDHQYFADYGPFFDINITPSVRKSQNTNEYIEEIINTISENLKNIKKRNPLRRIHNNNKEALRSTKATQGRKTIPPSHRKRVYSTATFDENGNRLSCAENATSKETLNKRSKNTVEDKNGNVNNEVIKNNGFIEKIIDTKKMFDFDEDF